MLIQGPMEVDVKLPANVIERFYTFYDYEDKKVTVCFRLGDGSATTFLNKNSYVNISNVRSPERAAALCRTAHSVRSAILRALGDVKLLEVEKDEE